MSSAGRDVQFSGLICVRIIRLKWDLIVSSFFLFLHWPLGMITVHNFFLHSNRYWSGLHGSTHAIVLSHKNLCFQKARFFLPFIKFSALDSPLSVSRVPD